MKTPKINIQGILLVDKPGLLSSNTVLQEAKRLFSAAKAGHMGSLDPLATGMLPICFGDATKFAQYGLDADKCYSVTAQFGITTTTGDAQGEVLSSIPNVKLSSDDILTIMKTFIGNSLQIPPMYSALKHQGKKLYELARAGIEIERQARPILIHRYELLHLEMPYAQFKVYCSKGTYIRTLMEDLGAKLGVGAHVTQLHRVFTAGFEQERMYTIDEIRAFTLEERMHCLLPIDYMLQHLPIATLSAPDLHKLYQGQKIAFLSEPSLQYYRVYNEEGLFQGLGEYEEESSTLKPKRLLAHEPC